MTCSGKLYKVTMYHCFCVCYRLMYLHVLILIVRAGIKAGFTYNQVNQVRQYVVQPPYLLVIT